MSDKKTVSSDQTAKAKADTARAAMLERVRQTQDVANRARINKAKRMAKQPKPIVNG
jgi:hypothetical protein